MKYSINKVFLVILLSITLLGCSSEKPQVNTEIETLKRDVDELKTKLQALERNASSGSWILWKRYVGVFKGPGFQVGPSPSTVVAAYSSKDECVGSIQPVQDWSFVCLPKGVHAPFAK